uniref:Uncharacterized protein n=1 Tax=Medicago truncatula TaxID=3880 RepID=I3S1E5_MEDTR|nr:unknown [Medicago truncatula]
MPPISLPATGPASNATTTVSSNFIFPALLFPVKYPLAYFLISPTSAHSVSVSMLSPVHFLQIWLPASTSGTFTFSVTFSPVKFLTSSSPYLTWFDSTWASTTSLVPFPLHSTTSPDSKPSSLKTTIFQVPSPNSKPSPSTSSMSPTMS